MTTEAEMIEKGRNLAESLQFKDALEQFKATLKAHPDSLPAQVWLGRLHLMRGETAVALDLLRAVLAAQPHHAEALALQGLHHVLEGRPAQALPLLQQAAKADPGLHMAQLNLSVCHRELGELERAEQAARRAVDLRPEDFESLYELGQVLVERGHVEEGLRALTRSVQANPLFAKGYVTLGRLVARGGQLEVAQQVYEEALKHITGVPELQEGLCDVLALRGDWPRALVEARKLAEERHGPGDWLRVGEYALARGYLDEALQANAEFNKLEPEAWQGYYNMAEVFSVTEKLEEAREAYQAAIDRAGAAWQPFNGMGLLLLHHGNDPREAGACFVNALEAAPGRVEPLLNLALTQAVLKDWENAAKLVGRVLEGAPAGHPVRAQAERLSAEIAKERQTP
jgi:tetratricopeptide (TPR) repeat protein